MTLENELKDEEQRRAKRLEFLKMEKDEIENHPIKHCAKNLLIPGYALYKAEKTAKGSSKNNKELKKELLIRASILEGVKAAAYAYLVYESIKLIYSY